MITRNTTSIATTPDENDLATSTPSQYANRYDHSFTLQAIMELQKSTGQLTESLNSLRNAVEKQDAKLDKIQDTVSGVTHKLYAAGVVLAIALAIGGFLVNKAWDLMAQQLVISQSATFTSKTH